MPGSRLPLLPLPSSVAFIPPFFPCVLRFHHLPPICSSRNAPHSTLLPLLPSLSSNTRHARLQALQNKSQWPRKLQQVLAIPISRVVVDIIGVIAIAATHMGAPLNADPYNFFQHCRRSNGKIHASPFFSSFSLPAGITYSRNATSWLVDRRRSKE